MTLATLYESKVVPEYFTLQKCNTFEIQTLLGVRTRVRTMIKILDRGKGQTIIATKGPTALLMLMQKLENRFIFFLCSHCARLGTITLKTFSLFPLNDEDSEWLNQQEHLNLWCQSKLAVLRCLFPDYFYLCYKSFIS